MRAARWAWLWLVVLCIALAAPGEAWAAKKKKKAGGAKKPKIVVLDLRGDDGGAAKKVVIKALKKKATVVAASGTDIGAARTPGVTAVVVGDVSTGKKKGSVVVMLSVHEGATGDTIATSSLKSPSKAKLGKVADKQLWRDIGKAVVRAKPAKKEEEPVAAAPPPEPAPEPAPTPTPKQPAATAAADTGADTDTDTAAAAGSATAAGDSPLGVSARVRRPSKLPAIALWGRPFNRSLTYNDDLDARLRTYSITAASVGLGLEWYGLSRHFGLAAGYEQAVGLTGSETEDGTAYETKASSFHGGLRARASFGKLGLAAAADFGRDSFTIDDGAMDLVPSVTYTFARGGLTLAYPLASRLALHGGGGYRYLLSSGELESAAWFPRSTGAGADAHVGLAFRLGGGISATARAELVRWFFAMNPEPGDPWIAGGAVDQYLSAAIGLTWTP